MFGLYFWYFLSFLHIPFISFYFSDESENIKVYHKLKKFIVIKNVKKKTIKEN